MTYFRTSLSVGRILSSLVLAALFLAGCSDSTPSGPELPTGELTAVVVNSVEVTLTVFPVADPSDRRTVPLGPEGSPVGASVRGELAAVPMGIVPAVAIVDLAAGEVIRTVALSEGSGATGSHFVNDSIVLVANPGLNTVSPVNVLRGTVGAAIETGRYPQGFAESGGRIFVVNSELENFAPAGPGTLTVLDSGTLEALGSVELSGENSGGMTVGSDGRLFVMNSGRFGEASGTLSVVDPASMSEVGFHTGFGEFPGMVVLASNTRLLFSSWSFGVAEWNPSTGSFVRPPDAAAAPGGIPSAAGVAVDPEGGIWSLKPVCDQPSAVFELSAELEVLSEVSVGLCPTGMVFTTF